MSMRARCIGFNNRIDVQTFNLHRKIMHLLISEEVVDMKNFLLMTKAVTGHHGDFITLSEAEYLINELYNIDPYYNHCSTCMRNKLNYQLINGGVDYKLAGKYVNDIRINAANPDKCSRNRPGGECKCFPCMLDRAIDFVAKLYPNGITFNDVIRFANLIPK